MIYLFDNNWFYKHQKKLLWLLKFRLFKYILRIETNKKIIGILPNVYFIKGNKKNKYIADFRTHNKYSKRLYHAFKYIWYLFHAWDMAVNFLRLPVLNLGFDTLTVYPDAGTGATTVDGFVRRVVDSGTWADIHDGVGTSVNATSASETYFYWYFGGAGNELRRTILTFDTSSLGSGATISAAVMSLFGAGKADGAGKSPNIDIYASTPASNNNLVAADYQQIGTTSQTGSPITYANYSTTTYNDFTFNSTGTSTISTTGISKFGARNANYDVANVDPASTSFGTYMSGYYADQAGTANDPKLVITYTPGAVVSGFIPKIIMY